jgi:hypothetical protein
MHQLDGDDTTVDTHLHAVQLVVGESTGKPR